MNTKNGLNKWGLIPSIQEEFNKLNTPYYLARVITENKDLYTLATHQGIIQGKVRGKWMHESKDYEDYPCVGDWVIVDRETDHGGIGQIQQMLPRYSKIGRKVTGNRTDTQILAANMDVIFICMALNQDFNIRRLERYLAISVDSGALPVVLLTKCDLCPDLEQFIDRVRSVTNGVDVIPISSLLKINLDQLNLYVTKSTSVVFVGSSGVGKSTLVNALVGEEILLTDGLRDDDKGRHTTVTRNLIPFWNNNVLIDTPGLRSIEMGDISESIAHVFDEIEELAGQCKFSDCTHTKEPGCAINAALRDGSLDQARYNSYKKLLKEAEFIRKKSKKKLR